MLSSLARTASASLALVLLPATACDTNASRENPTVHGSLQKLVVGFRWIANERTLVKWDEATRHNLTYCLSEVFEASERARVRTAMLAASGRWESAADVNFDEVTATSGASCDPYYANTAGTERLQAAFFMVIPVLDLGSTKESNEYGARAFYPYVSEPPLLRISTNWLAANSDPADLAALLTHELGHVLGFLHEHTREGCLHTIQGYQLARLNIEGTKALTVYDPDSIMHYGMACGRIDPDPPRELSNLDRLAVACLYGRPGTGRTPEWCEAELWDIPGPEFSAWSGTWTHTIYGPITP